ncbi:MAG TPA: MiaB/RimO family radical SAM methylthiotransferase [Solirubrobacteraceae bacterium]|nr:MiaB/RimO family radical SAM methylthiotransferase [Solirubrobacteraceae bacterium]
MATFAVRFLGCKVSQADAMLARDALLAAGHREASEEEAQLQVVNTCAITAEAEAKSRQAVRRALRAGRRVYASGCAVNLHPHAFEALGDGVVALPGAAESVAGQIAGRAAAGVQTGATACADTEHEAVAGAAHGPSRTRRFVKVQDGCDLHCAYCIIPRVRGAARSRPAAGILREVARAAAAGQAEVVLTGISIGDWRDPVAGLELGDLLRAVARVPGVARVRLSSIEVIHLRESLIEALAGEPAACPHLHVPLQSGDDGVLAAMGRRYTAAEYLDRIARVRRVLSDVNITTDVIVGFPGEDEAAFGRTLETVERAGITRVHVFPYSARPGTVAAALPDVVQPDDKRRRGQAMRALSQLLSRQQRAARLGARERVLVDKTAASQCSGYTADYVRCYLPGGCAPAGALIDVVCEELYADGIRCTPAG